MLQEKKIYNASDESTPVLMQIKQRTGPKVQSYIRTAHGNHSSVLFSSLSRLMMTSLLNLACLLL